MDEAMRYLTAYSIAAAVTLGLWAYDPGQTGEPLIAIGAHVCGCMFASILWVSKKTNEQFVRLAALSN